MRLIKICSTKIWLAAAILLATFSAWSAETNRIAVITTNWVMTAANFREIGGQLYNVEKSQRFSSFSGTIKKIFANGVVIETTVAEIAQSGAVQMGPRDIYIINYPQNPPPITDSLREGRAMKIGVTNFGDKTIFLYDYGTPKKVAVVKTNYVSE